jgi:hypothetical protein
VVVVDTSSAEFDRVNEGASTGPSRIGATDEEERIALRFCPVTLELENTPSNTDHRRRLLRWDRIELALLSVGGFEVVGSTDVPAVGEAQRTDCDPRRIAS